MMRRVERLSFAVGVALVVVAAGCGSSAHGASDPVSTTGQATARATAPAPASTTTPSVADLEVSLAQFAAHHGDQVNRSPVQVTASGIFAAVSFNVQSQGTYAHVEIVGYVPTDQSPVGEAGWAVITDVTLDVGGVVSPGTTAITAVSLTGTVLPDFAVTTNYNAGNATALIADTAGHWHALGFQVGDATPVDEVINATVDSQTITDIVNDCVPDCAHGSTIHHTYRYNPSADTMSATT